jgi:hypothetical protein
MTLRINGSTSGYTEIDSPAVGANNTLVLPTGNGSDGNILSTDGAGNLSWVNGRMVLATAQNTTSGTSIDFTGIPSWVKRVTVMLNGVSTNGVSPVIVQCGAGSVTTSGYIAYVYAAQGSTGVTLSFTTGFAMDPESTAVFLRYGHVTLTNITGNNWVAGIIGGCSNATNFRAIAGGGSVGLSGTLDRLRLTTVNGTDTFDAGSINILYEG